jgi:phage gp36-like protein
MAAYATGSDLAARYDIRIWGQLVSDDGLELSRFDMQSSPNVTTALEDASAEVDSYLRRAGIYQQTEIDALTGNALSELKRVTCAIAMALIVKRRPGSGLAEFAATTLEEYRQILKDFRDGLITFGLTAQEAASLPEVVGPTSIDLQNLNTIATRMAPRFLPDPATRLPLNRG